MSRPRLLLGFACLLTAHVGGCVAGDAPFDDSPDNPAAGESNADPSAAGGLTAACDGSAGQWAGCRGTGCAVCSETTQRYPYYFVNHPACTRNLTCDGVFSTCNANCPTPINADKQPAPGSCNGTTGQWAGCRGNGCAVCSEKLTAYPFYFLNHPNCVRNDTCAGQFGSCNASCPAPTEADKNPPAGTCNGTSGQWAGCRGNGCAVCAEKLADFPNYLKNHPTCTLNTSCAGQFGTCNSNCPTPTDADRAPAAPRCDGTSGQWAGCRGNGCAVCGELTPSFPYYFANHPLCDKNLTCDGQFGTCNANCPAPASSDKQPAAGVCEGTAGTWAGCRGNGCAVCGETLTSYPYYFHHHPKCARNDSCGGQLFTCNANCPAPADGDKQPPAGTCNGTPGQWAGCRGNGCAVCSDKVAAYPLYFKNHPSCVSNGTCGGLYGTCNANCPAPTDADRGAPAFDPFAPARNFCPSGGVLSVSADNKWDVYSDGVRLKPTDATNVESDWRKPAKYALSLAAGVHVLAVHAADTAGGKTGLIANLSVKGMPWGGGLTAAQTDWRVLPTGQTPPSNWTTASSLAWARPPVATKACTDLWSKDGTFTANWTAVAGAAPATAWVWNKSCDSTQAGWQKDNWYRLVITIRCDSGSTTCPDGTACPVRDALGITRDIGSCKAGVCKATACDDLGASIDGAGNVVLPTSVADLASGGTAVSESVDEDVGVVSSATDGADSVGQCEPAVGKELPDGARDYLTQTANNNGDAPMTEIGLSITPNQVAAGLKDAMNPTGPTMVKIIHDAALATPSWSTIVASAAKAPTYVEPAVCDGERDPTDPFAGRDIIFVHGFDPDTLSAKALREEKALRTWAGDREDFYSGYYKRQADAYWKQHIKRYLGDPGHKNRYVTVAWSTNERMDVAVDAMLTQVSDAMRTGRGVVATPGDGRGQVGFCVPSCVIISHSTGAPVTDVAMTIANETPSLKFIPDHIKTHVSMEGAYAGSPLALMAVALTGGLGVVSATDLCKLYFRMIGLAAVCNVNPDFSKTVNTDLIPTVAAQLWQPLMARTPVPTLTVAGGHADRLFPFFKMLFPGFDDDTLTNQSSCANPSAGSGPPAFVPTSAASLFDLGMIKVSSPLAIYTALRTAERPLGYWLDQVVDPMLWGPFPGAAAAGCTTNLSPWGMVQPVMLPVGGPNDPEARLRNHFTFVQAAAEHSIASIDDFGRDYQPTLIGGNRSFEETRVITDDSVYVNTGNDLRSRDGRDKAPLVAAAMKTMQRESVKGWRFTIGFGSFKKRFWIWKRRYHQLDQMQTKDQGDYVYENVATTGPAPGSSSLALCGAKQTVATGWAHSCAIKPDGTVRCWGDGSRGQLGNNTTTSSVTPVTVANLSHAGAVTAGDFDTCALRRDGTVWCWGNVGLLGQSLGDGTFNGAPRPVQVSGLTDVVSLSAGSHHTCASKRDGTVWCWGSDAEGQLGDGGPTPTTVVFPTPRQALNLVGVASVAAGSYHTCAVTKGGAVWCWGANSVGQLGTGAAGISQYVPQAVVGLGGVGSLGGGNNSMCATKIDGTIWCWGNLSAAITSDGSQVASAKPVQLAGFSGRALAVTEGYWSSCVLADNGTASCWGDGISNGVLGNGVASGLFPTPQPVTGPSGLNALSSARIHSCAMSAAGSVWCWGNNDGGDLGGGSTSPHFSATPIAVQGL